METLKPICVVGSIVYDFVMSLPRFPDPGETVLGTRFATFIGGKGLNTAMQIHRLGAPVSFWGRMGADRLGQEVLEVLAKQGFSTDGIRVVEGEQTATGMIYVMPDGMNMIGGVPSANMNFRVEEVDERMAKAIRKASVVSVQLEIPDEANEQVLRLAKQAHVPTILNAAPFRDIPESYSDLADYWIVNEIEASQFCGCVIQRAEDCEPICCHPQIMSGRQVWVVTLGRNGAVLIDSLGLRDVPGIEVNAVDSTGAGDSFTGGFAVGIAEGMNAYEAAQFANKIAALSVTKLGGMSGLPTRVEYIARFGVQEQTV